MIISGTEIINVIRDFGELGWSRGSVVIKKEEDLKHPPVIAWRYKEPNPKIEQAIVDAVNSFPGSVDWEIRFCGRNWVIAPRRVREFRETREFKVDIEALRTLANEEPKLGEMANKDISRLAEHIRKTIEAKIISQE